MIQACIPKKSGKVIGFELSGHAMSGAFGHDIVCSAVSALAIATVNGIESQAQVQLSLEVSDGYLKAQVPNDLSEEQEKVTQILLRSFSDAMVGIEAEYKDYLKVKIN